MKLKQTFLAGIFVLVILSNGFSQRIDGTNTAYEEGDWISYTQCRHVNSIQAAHDLIYVATEGGILRYDFYAHEWLFPFTISNGLPDNYILAVAFDVATNLLWCSTREAVSVYDRGSHIWQNYYLDELRMAGNDPVLSFGFEKAGVWLETGSGKHYFSPLNQTTFTEVSGDPDKSVVWFGARGFTPGHLDYYFLPNSLMFIEDAHSYSIQDTNLRNFGLDYYLVDPWQTIWVGTNGLGMFTADTRIRQMKPLPYGLLNPDVHAMAKNNREFWIGGIQQESDRSGVTDWNLRSKQWKYFEPRYISRFRNDKIKAIAIQDNTIWFGTCDGLIRYRTDKNSWRSLTVFDGLQDNKIYTLAQQDTLLYVGSNDGLDLITEFTQKSDSLVISPVTKPKDRVSVYDIYIDDNLVWAGTGYGLYVYDRMKNEGGYYRGADGPGVEPVFAVDRLRDSLWVATLHTVEVYDLKNEIWRGSPARKLFPETKIFDLVTSDGAVWVGTDDGLYKHHVHKGYWKQFTRRDGLLHPRVQKLLVDGDYLWIGSPQGLTRFYWNSPFRID
ncbi:MAG TPA: hypothetical protein ENH29_07345 [Bacteroidetes bacterium]|nr:hypothetical protein [Bacteroidota bacterium]